MLSIVVPTLNEAERVGLLGRHLGAVAPGVEVVVVDGGSTDGTPAAARAAGLTVVEASRPGRGVQMNEGAAVATGDHLLFLHADTALPVGVGGLVAGALADPAISLGAFTVRLDRQTAALAVIELGIRLRCRFGRLPFGDQALFLRRETFDALGGYRPIFMEDADLVRRARALGGLVVLPAEVVTSARRWEEHGVLRTTARNWVLTAKFLSGRG